MWQWMGGSRRKVTTSRKSVQKRQQQYFEQRRRLRHQRTPGTEIDEEKNCRRQSSHRSLDVLSLLSLSKISQGCQIDCSDGKKDEEKILAPTVVSNAKEPPPPTLPKVKEKEDLFGGPSSSIFSKCLLSDPLVNHSNTSDTKDKSEFLISKILDDDDGLGDKLECPAHEAHVEFFAKGLGDLESETPPYLSGKSGRCIFYDFSTPRNVPRHLNSSVNIDYFLDDLEREVPEKLNYFNTSLRSGSLEFLTKDVSDCQLETFSNDRTHLRFDDDSFDVMESLVKPHSKSFCFRKTDNEEIWDAGSFSLDTDFLGEKKLAGGSPELNRRHHSFRALDFRDSISQPTWSCLLCEESCSSSAAAAAAAVDQRIRLGQNLSDDSFDSYLFDETERCCSGRRAHGSLKNRKASGEEEDVPPVQQWKSDVTAGGPRRRCCPSGKLSFSLDFSDFTSASSGCRWATEKSGNAVAAEVGKLSASVSENGPACNVASSSVKTTENHISESSINEDREERAVEGEGAEEREEGGTNGDLKDDSSSRMVMVEGFVVKLVCVQQESSKEAAALRGIGSPHVREKN